MRGENLLRYMHSFQYLAPTWRLSRSFLIKTLASDLQFAIPSVFCANNSVPFCCCLNESFFYVTAKCQISQKPLGQCFKKVLSLLPTFKNKWDFKSKYSFLVFLKIWEDLITLGPVVTGFKNWLRLDSAVRCRLGLHSVMGLLHLCFHKWCGPWRPGSYHHFLSLCRLCMNKGLSIIRVIFLPSVHRLLSAKRSEIDLSLSSIFSASHPVYPSRVRRLLSCISIKACGGCFSTSKIFPWPSSNHLSPPCFVASIFQCLLNYFA